MAGHIYVSGSAPSFPQAKMAKSARRHRKHYRLLRNRGRGRSRSRSRSQNYRRSRSTWLSWFSSEELGLGANNYDNYEMDWLVPATCEPIQSVYFFSEGGSPCPPCSWSGWVVPAVPGPWGLTTALEW